jgi:ribosomal protein S18 acetylase RimI-like enzyme
MTSAIILSMQPGQAMQRDEIRYEVLQAADVEGMIDLIARAFSAGDPPAVAMRLSAAELRAFLEPLAPRALEDGLTIVARTADGKLAGALLSDDFAAAQPIDAGQLSPGFLPILALLDALDEQYRSGREIAKGQYLHLFMLAVDAAYGGRGIAQGLVNCCLENGARHGYQWVVTEATGVVSQRVFGKLGFEERLRIFYQQFTYNGNTVFASISGPSGVALMDKSLAGLP